MPTIFTHTIVGILSTKIAFFKNIPKKVWILSAIVPIIPDFDVIAFKLGIPYGDFWGHRGFFHSLTFAFILALIICFLFFREKKLFSKKWILILAYFWIIISSHAVLDALTKGGYGVAFFSPFDTTRYNFAITPIMISPIHIDGFLSEYGLQVVLSELLWIIFPLGVIAILLTFFRSGNRTVD